MLTEISTGLFGQQHSTALTASHGDTSFTISSDRPTTLAFVNLNNGQATYTFYDKNSAGRRLAVSDLPAISATDRAPFWRHFAGL
ncbi:MAG: hypothetical protein COB16_10385 [Rhodobacteraceae bacterium]|nr:MAG: hypothetical protein COB16_10385 [Paracoccaceae bacterium]